MEKNDIAVPGEFLGYEEEVVGDANTFVDGGKVYSDASGAKKVTAGKAEIRPRKTVRRVRPGDIVYGKVQDIYDSVSLIEIEAEPAKERIAVGASYAFLRISELDNRYVNSFREYIRIGDVMRLKVIDVTSMGTYLSISEPGLGVLAAFCSYCRAPLDLKGRLLVCPACGNREVRKIA
ncbi:MAG: exosome complex RNA-binding protein Csl4 [Candidatus Micrarchaeota archaeon]